MSYTIPTKEYQAIHYWLKKNFGKASKCESLTCTKLNTTYQWAKKKDCAYEKVRDNFMQLCRVCHSKYDIKEDTISKMKANSKNANKKACIRGHVFTKETTYFYKGYRHCRLCKPQILKKWKINDAKKRLNNEELRTKFRASRAKYARTFRKKRKEKELPSLTIKDK